MPLDGGKAYLYENGAAREIKHEDIGYVYSLPILPEFLTGYEFIEFFMDINKDKLQMDCNSDSTWIRKIAAKHTLHKHSPLASYFQQSLSGAFAP